MEHLADLHVHTSYSHDSLLPPRFAVKAAKRAGLTCIAITDHDEIRGALKAKEYEDDTLRVVVGEEILTDAGDIIALEITEPLKERHWRAVIQEIRDAGGISVLPHPYRRHTNVDEIICEVDAVETWNGRCTDEENWRMVHLNSKRKSAGSDAHTFFEVGRVIGVVDDDLRLKTMQRLSDGRPEWRVRWSKLLDRCNKFL